MCKLCSYRDRQSEIVARHHFIYVIYSDKQADFQRGIRGEFHGSVGSSFLRLAKTR